MSDLGNANFKNWVDDVPPYTKPIFYRLLNLLRKHDRPILLEIGAYNGRSMIEMLSFLPQAHGIVIDPWMPSDDPYLVDKNMTNIEEEFDNNVRSAGMTSRITKYKGDSKRILPTLEENSVDFIYVDGCHKCLDVHCDLIFSWRLLKSGGLLMIDDYLWLLNVAQPIDIPYYAVEHFLLLYENQYTILYHEYRLCLQKL